MDILNNTLNYLPNVLAGDKISENQKDLYIIFNGVPLNGADTISSINKTNAIGSLNLSTIDLYNNDVSLLQNDNILKEWKNIKIINGQYGIYIKKGKRNIPIKLPKEEIIAMSLIKCEEYIKNFKQTRKKGKKYKNTKK